MEIAIVVIYVLVWLMAVCMAIPPIYIILTFLWNYSVTDNHKRMFIREWKRRREGK